MFVEREGFLSTADTGAPASLPFPSDSGDIHLGVYNGEGYLGPARPTERRWALHLLLAY